VLLLLEDLGGGTGNHVCRMVSLWKNAGWEVVVVTPMTPLVRQLPAGVDVRVVRNTAWYHRFPLVQALRLIALRRIVRSLQPDVVHTYFFWSIIYGRILRRLGDVRVLVENREDMGFSWGTGSYRTLRATRSIPDQIICVAEAVRQVALAKEGASEGRTTVVRNGVELAGGPEVSREKARQSFGFTDDEVVIGMVANLPRAVKGGRQLLDCISSIVKEAPNARFLLVGLGTDPESLRPELESRGIPSHVVVGAGYRRDVELCYAAMDISVLTSSTEGLSITLLESMRCGLPTVVTHVGGNPELVVDSKTGYLVAYGDAPAFVDRVAALVRDAALRRTMGEAGRRRVVENFAIEDVAQRYLDVYEQLLGGAVPRRTSAPEIT
jgi:glycosyltransferase involved in cell wall biosynthesis